MKRTVKILMTYAQEQLDYYTQRIEQTQQESKTAINHPEYYSSGGIEAIDFIEAHNLNFNRGNVVKYITRAGRKDNEPELTALQKAKWYLEREIYRLGHLNEAGDENPCITN